jgi:predicted amidohydrolase YtcJ
MTKRLSLMMIAMLLVACGSQEVEAPQIAETPAAVAETRPEVADAVYTNGKIYTVDEAQPWAEAVAIKDGKFVAVGSADDVAAVTGDSTEVVDLAGAFAMPGIGDTHIHPSLVMPKRAFCGLPGTFHEPSEAQTIDALKECIANYPDDRAWFIATGWTMRLAGAETGRQAESTHRPVSQRQPGNARTHARSPIARVVERL